MMTREEAVSRLCDVYGGSFDITRCAEEELRRATVMQKIRGIKFEGKMSKSGYGSLVLKKLEFYDTAGNLVTEFINPNEIASAATTVKKAFIHGNVISYSQMSPNATLQLFDLNGNLLKRLSLSGSGSLELSALCKAKGIYFARISDRGYTQNLRISR